MVPGIGVWAYGCVFWGGMSDAMGSNTCSTDFSANESLTRNKKVESKKRFFDSIRSPVWALPFSPDGSDCVRIDLKANSYLDPFLRSRIRESKRALSG